MRYNNIWENSIILGGIPKAYIGLYIRPVSLQPLIYIDSVYCIELFCKLTVIALSDCGCAGCFGLLLHSSR